MPLSLPSLPSLPLSSPSPVLFHSSSSSLSYDGPPLSSPTSEDEDEDEDEGEAAEGEAPGTGFRRFRKRRQSVSRACQRGREEGGGEGGREGRSVHLVLQ